MVLVNFEHTYSQHVHDARIALLGPIPPPLGGVSVHLDRVAYRFAQQRNKVLLWDSTVEYRYRYAAWYRTRLAAWLCYQRPNHVYYHTSYLHNALSEMRLLVQLKPLLKYSLTLIEHDCRHMYGRSAIFKNLFQRIVKHVDQLVLIGSKTYQSYDDAHFIMPNNTRVEGAFLPPNMAREEEIIKTYPVSLHAFLAHHDPVIVVNAFQVSRLHGVDLYGIDLSLQMLAVVAQRYPRVGLVIALGAIGDERYFKDLCFLAHKLHVDDRIYILTPQKELWPLFKRIDLFVRPTVSDGASVSVQEALYFGVPVVASDVCARPAGTFVFENRHLDTYVSKVLDALSVGHISEKRGKERML